MPGRMKYQKVTEVLSMSDMVAQISDALKKQATEPNLYGYKPHAKQLEFHKASTFGRLFLAGNRVGKTVGGVVEDIMWATKRHPYIRIPSDTEIRGRALSVDITKGIEGILLPVFKQWLLPSDLKNGSWEDSWDRRRNTLVLADGSFVEFLTYEQDLEKHAGTSRHFIHFDEEPPEAIFNENKLRLLDTNGKWWITMTPVNGMTWVYDTYYEPEKGRPKNITIVEADMDDNPYLSEEAKENVLSGLSADERAARKSGRFMARGGLVYSEFMESVHCTMPAGWLPPSDWTIWTSLDAGLNCPTAIGYHAVRPDGRKIVTFHEMYGAEKLIKDWAKEMLEFEKENKLRIYQRTGDPAMKQRSQQTGISTLSEFRDHGIVMSVDFVPKDTSIGVTKLKQYMRPNPKDANRPYWEMTRNCKVHAYQLKRLSWETFESRKMQDQRNPKETIKKLNDHAPDELRYFMTAMPDLVEMKSHPQPSPLLEAAKVNDYIHTLVVMEQAPPDSFTPWSEAELAMTPDDEDWF